MAGDDEEIWFQISGIQHFEFCRRQWALMYIEQQWADNLRTVEGDIIHERVHDPSNDEKRVDKISVSALEVRCNELHINGVCDIVEFIKDDSGVPILGREGLWRVCPVEYKRGEPKTTDMDRLQLTAQALCLEEMLVCEIKEAAIFYHATAHREHVVIDDELRRRVREVCGEMYDYYTRRYTPLVKPTRSCNACSMKELCLPSLIKKKSVTAFIGDKLKEE